MQFKWIKYVEYSRSYWFLYIKNIDEILSVPDMSQNLFIFENLSEK